jgi:hypothetical protein
VTIPSTPTAGLETRAPAAESGGLRRLGMPCAPWVAASRSTADKDAEVIMHACQPILIAEDVPSERRAWLHRQ